MTMKRPTYSELKQLITFIRKNSSKNVKLYIFETAITLGVSQEEAVLSIIKTLRVQRPTFKNKLKKLIA